MWWGPDFALVCKVNDLFLIPLLEVGGLVKGNGDSSKTVTSKIILLILPNVFQESSEF